MKELTNQELQKWKETFAKDGIVYDTDEEYKEAVANLAGYFKVLIQIDQSLKPKGENRTT